MGLFSGLFGKEKKTFVSPALGEFTLVFSNGPHRIWSTKKEEISYTVRGTDDEPYAEQITFLVNAPAEIEKRYQKITQRFMDAFNEAELKIDFKDWKERFKIVGMEVMETFEGSYHWNICFEELKKPYNQFTLFIEGEKLTNFSIDS